jgi:DNA replication protein DnaC
MKRVGDLLGSVGRQGRKEERGDAVGPASEQTPGGQPAGSRSPSRRLPPLPPEDPCPICKGKGFLVYDVPAGHPDFGKLVPCRCTEARLAAQRAQSLRDVSNLGQLDRMTFDGFLPEGVSLPLPARTNLRQVFDLCQEFARDPQGWLVLVGGYGCGKTHLAAAIANFRIALGKPALFVVVADLLDYLRATYAPSSTVTFDERLDAIREAPLLILDDLGAHNSTPWAQEKLFQILNHRYNGQLPTVITSNQRPEEQDARIASRLRDLDLSRVQEILASDFRGSGPSSSERVIDNVSTLTLHGDQLFETFSLRKELSAHDRANLQKVLNSARAFAEEPDGWLVFQGTFGCGKTHLAAAIANYQVTAGRAAPMFVVVPDLLDHLRATFSPTSTTTLDKVFEQVRSTPLLILDDLGTESATPWAREKLFQLFNHRYAGRLPTVITTINSIEVLEPRLRARMLDRTRCTTCAILAPSYYGGVEAKKKDKEPGSGPIGRGKSRTDAGG